MRNKALFICALWIACLVVLLPFYSRLQFDPAAYANFSDQRTYFGIRNFWNVATNLVFLYVGGVGLIQRRKAQNGLPVANLVFYWSVFLTAFGSAYFHWRSTGPALFWDQLPMSVGFSSFMVVLIADRVDPVLAQKVFWAWLALAALTVAEIYYGTGDTHYYCFLQAGSILFVLILIGVKRHGCIETRAVLFGLGLYVLAKIVEALDGQIYALTRPVGGFSGHSIKHLLAGAGVWILIRELLHASDRESVEPRDLAASVSR